MTRLKSDLQKDLDQAVERKKSASSSSSNGKATATATTSGWQEEKQLHEQIQHLDDQIKGVLFLLMQCQIGLDSLAYPKLSELPAASLASTLKAQDVANTSAHHHQRTSSTSSSVNVPEINVEQAVDK